MPDWTAQTNGSVTTVTFDDIAAGSQAWVLLRSDAHHDSPFCNRKLERRHLELAKQRDALILDNGDTFDAMQGRFDPRSALDEIREEDRCDNFYGSIVEHAAEDYLPYAKQWAMIGKGNHERAVLKKANIDLISNLVYRLNSEGNANIQVGGYFGYVILRFRMNKTKIQTYRIRYHHGAGGGAPVTRGVIQTNRQAVFLPDANIVWNGHNHQNYVLPISRERVNARGKIYNDILWFLRTPGYKDERKRSEGYSGELNSGPTPLGCVWLNFKMRNDKMHLSITSDIE